ncbi:MAG: substrate-binding domain-containing protein [Anaerolineales bacterium]|nr:substrate-binding domain-containing protein [Anaerolineales bacterium]
MIVLDWAVQTHGANVSTIAVDFQRGIDAAVEHLYELGHRRYAHVGGPPQLQTSQDRRAAFLRRCPRHGIDPADVPVIDGNLRRRRAPAHCRGARAAQMPPLRFAANDMTALGILFGGARPGLAVPRDLPVVGLDDIWLAAQSDPPLTTVALLRCEIGHLPCACSSTC